MLEGHFDSSIFFSGQRGERMLRSDVKHASLNEKVKLNSTDKVFIPIKAGTHNLFVEKNG